jgi:hypothetical protein
MARIPIGDAGTQTSCAASGCIFDSTYCATTPVANECNIHKDEVAEKCGPWKECGGVICTLTSGDFCVARRYLDNVKQEVRRRNSLTWKFVLLFCVL